MSKNSADIVVTEGDIVDTNISHKFLGLWVARLKKIMTKTTMSFVISATL
jgi:hypothetical protein